MPRRKVEITRGDMNIVKRAVARGLDDGSPSGEDARKIYSGLVSGAYDSWLRLRLEYMIRLQERELNNPMGTREQDILCKGAINAFSLLLDFGDEMKQEFASYQPQKEVNQMDRNSPSGSGEIISSML